MKLGVNQQRQINVEAQNTCELKCKEIKWRRKTDYMMSDWLSHTGCKETTFKGCHDTQPSSSLSILYVSDIWACTYPLPQIDGFTF